MAIYHLSTKPISRSSGRSAVASVAYRAGIEIKDERLGKTYDYTKRNGVLWTGLVTPNGYNIERSELWNMAEKIETRDNSRTAREIVINIPHELMQGDQSTGKMLSYEFATILSQKYGVAVDIAVHAPDKHGDNRNYHAHLLLTTRQIVQSEHNKFEFGKKSQLEMSNAQLKELGLLSNQGELKEIRKAWAEITNEYLAEHNIDERIDHRSHKDRGLNTLPTVKMGWQATELERKGIRTEVGDQNRAIKAYNALIEQKNKSKEQTNSWVQEWLDESLENSKRMAVDENYRQEIARRATNQGQDIQAILRKNLVKHQRQQQNTLENEHIEPTRHIKTKTYTTPADENLNANIAFLEHFKEQYEIANHFLRQSFSIYFNSEARDAFAQDVKKLNSKYLKLHDNYIKIKNSEPRFLGKKKWEQEKNQSYKQAMQAQKAYLELEAKQRMYSPSFYIQDKYTQIAFDRLMDTKPEMMEKAKYCDEFISKYETVLEEVRAKIPDFDPGKHNKQVFQTQEKDHDKGRGR